MLFNSFEFIILMIVSFIVYYIKILKNLQIYVLIISSLVFYSYTQFDLLLLLLMSAFVNAITSWNVFITEYQAKKFIYAFIGIAINLLILSIFKYSPMFGKLLADINAVKHFSEFLILIPLPIGISFYTFQGISLIADIYKKDFTIKTNFFTHLIHTIFFIAFFPQLIAGSIVKAKNFYSQIEIKYISNIDFHGSLKILILGYFFEKFCSR